VNIAIYNINGQQTKTIGYWAAQEQYAMENLLKFVAETERCGFDTTMTSDHFHPWWHDGGYENFTWIWIEVQEFDDDNVINLIIFESTGWLIAIQPLTIF
jgi:hypothetical protein